MLVFEFELPFDFKFEIRFINNKRLKITTKILVYECVK